MLTINAPVSLANINEAVWSTRANTNRLIFIDNNKNAIFSIDDCSQDVTCEVASVINNQYFANLFMEELLDSVETLSGIAEEHGVETLAGLFYLQKAILNNSYIDHYSEETGIIKIVNALPSREKWMEYIVEIG
jgi:hypothetical protein